MIEIARCSELWAAKRATAAALCSTVDVRATERVLDVAGDGAVAFAAAQRGAEVVRTNDVLRLPFPDGAFDVVLSAFGAACAGPRAHIASELRRVCRTG